MEQLRAVHALLTSPSTHAYEVGWVSNGAVGGAAQQFGGFRALHDGKHGAEGVTLNKDASEGARDGPKGAHPINWARLWPLTTVLAHGSVDAARLP